MLENRINANPDPSTREWPDGEREVLRISASPKPMFSAAEERRYRALEIAVRQAHSQYDAASIIGNAKRFEEFLRGKEEEKS